MCIVTCMHKAMGTAHSAHSKGSGSAGSWPKELRDLMWTESCPRAVVQLRPESQNQRMAQVEGTSRIMKLQPPLPQAEPPTAASKAFSVCIFSSSAVNQSRGLWKPVGSCILTGNQSGVLWVTALRSRGTNAEYISHSVPRQQAPRCTARNSYIP